jgi:hypothetical protein
MNPPVASFDTPVSFISNPPTNTANNLASNGSLFGKVANAIHLAEDKRHEVDESS